MRRKPARHTNSLGLAIFIGSLLGLLILVALFIKVLLLVQHSSFDGKQQFSLYLEEPHATRFFVFNPQDASMRSIYIGNTQANPMALGVPVDARMQSTSDIASFARLAQVLLFGKNTVHTKLTSIDKIRLFIFIHTADTTKTVSQTLPLDASSTDTDTLLSKVFSDTTIFKEGESVTILNGTNTTGLGTKIARLLTHLGANVVAVTTADTEIPISSVSYVGNVSYTAIRIAHILQIPLVHLSTVGISDITITLGADFKASSN